MKKITLFAASFLLCTILSVNAFAQKTSTSCPSDETNLSLTVEQGIYNIQPDQVEPYVTKKTRGDQITAVFQKSNCSMDFILNLNYSPRYMFVHFPNGGLSYQAKFYNFDRVASVPLTNGDLISNSALRNFCDKNGDGLLDTSNVELNPDGKSYKYDNYAGCGYDAEGFYVRRNVGINLKDGTSADYRLRFQYSTIDNPGGNDNVAETSYIKVYHPTADTWIFAPETKKRNITTNGITTPTEGKWGAKLLYNGVFNLMGTYDMPFRFILKRV